MRKRAALYARFSTELQEGRSIDDQIALCRSYAEREGFTVVATFDDRARSGASVLNRDGLLALLVQAKEGAFDVVIVEALDRLSRSMTDLSSIHDRLTFMGIELRAVHEGRADTVTVGLRGLVAQLFREDGAKKVRRGMAGVIRDGRHAGGRAYGYRVVPGQRGALEVVPEEAEVLRRVFAAYAAGLPPRVIAGDLNRDGIPAPRGRTWNASTINGNVARGSGLISNELYAGRIVWNKVRMMKNPDTGLRVSRANPAGERASTNAPHLQIIDEALWDQVQGVKAAKAQLCSHMKRKPRHLLSGLLRCGVCGSGMSVHDRDEQGRARVRCSTVRESGTCTNRRVILAEKIERTVVDGLRDQLRDPRLIEIYVRNYNDERRRLKAATTRDRNKIANRLGIIEREHDRLLNGYIKGVVDEKEAEARIPALKQERNALRAELAAADQDDVVVALHPGLVDQYLSEISRLAAMISGDGGSPDQELFEAARSLIESVTVFPHGPRKGFEVEVKGRLAALIGGEAFPACGRRMVAEEGFEPPTQGL